MFSRDGGQFEIEPDASSRQVNFWCCELVGGAQVSRIGNLGAPLPKSIGRSMLVFQKYIPLAENISRGNPISAIAL